MESATAIRREHDQGDQGGMTSSIGPRDEGARGTARFAGRALAHPAHIRKLGWLMPRMLRAMPYLGYVVVGGNRV